MSGFVLDQVSVIHGAVRVLDAITAWIPARQCTGVVGPSGAGKSTLLRLLNRMEEPTSGRVLLDDQSLTDLDVLQLRRRVGLLAQQPTLLTDRVLDELQVGRPDLAPGHGSDLLRQVGLPAAFANRLAGELSGGEAQRLCLARALAVDPDVLLLDEPTSALDGLNVTLVADLARNHVAGGGTVVLASHDLAMVRKLAHWVLVLDHGHLIGAGPPDEIDYLQTG